MFSRIQSFILEQIQKTITLLFEGICSKQIRQSNPFKILKIVKVSLHKTNKHKQKKIDFVCYEATVNIEGVIDILSDCDGY